MDKWLTHNNFAKVLALVFSIILWAMVHLDSGTPVDSTTLAQSRYIDNVKIEVTGFDDDKYILYDLEPSSVRMEVKGKRLDLTTNFSDFKARLDLENLGPGTFTLPLTHELPPGVDLISMDPSIVKVTIEAKETRSMPVTIVTKGEPADGLVLGTPIVAGSGTVDVTLPASEVSDLSKVEGTVDVTGLKESVKGKSVKLTAYDMQGQPMENAKISPSSVDVEVPINKLYKNVPLEVRKSGQLPSGYVLTGVETDVEGVVLYGSKEALEGISSYPLTVDLSRFDGSTETKYSVDLTPPEGFEKIEPSSVTITIHVMPGGQKQLDGIPVTLKNTGSLYDVKWVRPTDPKLSLTVVGPSEVLEALQPESIQLTADLAHLGAGTHTVPIEVKLPQGVELADPSLSMTVDVELTEKGNPASGEPVEPTDPADGTQNQAGNGTPSHPEGEGNATQEGNSGNGT
ncbi:MULTISPECIES: CdaR family protein [Paenibacillus]|uniref:CdaR family protein n=1 Tax=Paenibacillus TaxID=44249 RepID=UPI00073F3923|nr:MULTISPECIES: CdaR family protein [Paenibacillus]MDU4694720.1 CdaR family protein [Paenibacillus sp.]